MKLCAVTNGPLVTVRYIRTEAGQNLFINPLWGHLMQLLYFKGSCITVKKTINKLIIIFITLIIFNELYIK